MAEVNPWETLTNTAQSGDFGTLEGLARTLAQSATLGMIGVRPTGSLAEWQAANPGKTLAAELAGIAIPYTGFYKASKNIGPLQRAMDAVADADRITKAPFTGRALRETVRYAPFEAARVGAGATFGEDLAASFDGRYIGTDALAQEALFNLAGAGVISGGFEKFVGGGAAREFVDKALPGADIHAPKQVQLRQMQEAIARGELDTQGLQNARSAIARLASQIRRGQPGDDTIRLQQTFGGAKRASKVRKGKGELPYIVGKLDGVSDSARKDLNRLFKPNYSKHGVEAGRQTVSRHFLSYGSRFGIGTTRRDLDAVLERAGPGFEQGFEGFVEFPRYIRGHKAGEIVSKEGATIEKALQKVDDNTWWAKSSDENGLFVMARKLSDDEYVLWKTDSPGRFLPEQARFANLNLKAARWHQDPQIGKIEGLETWNRMVDMRDDALFDPRGLESIKGSPGKLAQAFAKRLGLDKVEDSSITQGIKRFARDSLYPAMFQFKHPLAQRLSMIIQEARYTAERTANDFMSGSYKGSLGGISTAEALSGKLAATADSLDSLISQLGKKDLQDYASIVAERMSIDRAIKELEISPELTRFLREADTVDKIQFDMVNTAQRGVGLKPTQATENYFLSPHVWEGEFRAPVYDEFGKLVGAGGGGTRASAIKNAQAIVDRAVQDGRRWNVRVAEASRRGSQGSDDLWLRMSSNADAPYMRRLMKEAMSVGRTPGTFKKSKGLLGFKSQFTQEEVKRLLHDKLTRNQRYVADLFIDKALGQQRFKLSTLSKQDAVNLEKRIEQTRGVEGQFSAMVNQTVDTILGDKLGGQSASRIVGAANSLVYTTGLGFVNAAFNIANMLTFVQTSMPHVAFVLKASPASLSKYYTWLPINMQRKVGAAGSLDVLKVTGDSFRLMAKPDKVFREALGIAQREAVLTPGFMAEFVGQEATRRSGMRAALDTDGVVGFLKYLGTALPSMSERMARGHSFAMGWVLAKNVLRKADGAELTFDEMYNFARTFTQNSQFLYSTADRANIITGPIGSALGLFKNWMMHYIGWMAEYAGEAVFRNNWAPLSWMLAGTTAVGGIGGLPFVEMANSAAKMFDDKSLMLKLYEAYGEQADPIWYGLPAFLGVSLQNQVAAPFADPGQDAAFLFSFTHIDRIKALTRAGQGAWDAIFTEGVHPATNKEFYRNLMKAVGPKTMYRSMQLEDGALNSLTTGYPMIKGMSLPEQISYALGLNPTAVDIGYRVNEELWNNQQKLRDRVQTYGKLWYERWAEQDALGARQLVLRAIQEGVPVDSIMKSAQARIRKSQEDMFTRGRQAGAALPWVQADAIRRTQ